MKGFAITTIGIEDICAQELAELGAKKITIQKGGVLFEVSKHSDFIGICYRCQSADKIISHIQTIELSDSLEDLSTLDDVSMALPLLEGVSTFRASCLRRGEHSFSSTEAERVIGAKLFELFSKKGVTLSVNLTSPQVIFFISIVDSTCVIGIDLCGFDLQKRDYRIFVTPTSIKSTIAYSLLRYLGYEKKHELVDPFMGDGTFIIEAALFASKKAVGFYKKEKFAFQKLPLFRKMDVDSFFSAIDSKVSKENIAISGFDSAFSSVDFGKKNAKIAGVEKMIYLSRVESEWLDIKFKEKSVDLIVTKIPEQSRHIDQKKIEKLRHELFYQAEYILRAKGKVGLLCFDLENIRPHYEKFGFVVDKKMELYSGDMKLVMAVLSKGKKVSSAK